MAEDRRAGIREYRITQGSLFVKLYKVPGHSFSNMKKWIHCFQNVTCVVYFVDLASYDQVYLINYKNKLLASLEFFRSLINSHWFTRSSVILFLSNVDNFRRKLKHDRLSNYFPDYTGLNDVNSTSTYVIEKFTSQNWKHLAIYPLVSEASDYVNIRLFLVHVRESIQQRHLMNTGII
jgi:guanine nucleotide-binding protein G(i) subunit alpha